MGNNEQPVASCAVGKLNISRITLSAALAWTIAYVVCVAFGLAFPQWEMHSVWQAWLPGFAWFVWVVSFLAWSRLSLRQGLGVAFCADLQSARTTLVDNENE
ncbi:MAG: hypothetical protein ABI210_10100 [Abditibacteriaceae bacterium]